jgi:uncharacterized repeat protein (TIGR03803 family)
MLVNSIRIRLAAALAGLMAIVVGAQAATISTVATFNGSNGQFPRSGLIADAAGNLYGTTSTGGPSGFGLVYKLNPSTGTLTTLASFNGSSGFAPSYGNLLADSAGNLYGTTSIGGAQSAGTVFKLNPTTGALATLASFSSASTGTNANAGLVADSAGNLYGTTTSGGAGSFGTVFELNSITGSLTTLASFNNSTGLPPESPLVIDAAGNLYGTTTQSGAGNWGTVFKVSPGGGTPTTLVAFNNTNGTFPEGGLIADHAGNLYGITQGGGTSGAGEVFKFNLATNTLSVLASFNGANGTFPQSGLIADRVGNLYGTTQAGGANGGGTVFKVNPSTGAITVLASFATSSASVSYAPLMADAAGNLWGTTHDGGANFDGTIFEVTGTGFVATPEPSALTLLAVGSLALLVSRAWWKKRTSSRAAGN